jgi:hypothetical protein
VAVSYLAVSGILYACKFSSQTAAAPVAHEEVHAPSGMPMPAE